MLDHVSKDPLNQNESYNYNKSLFNNNITDA